MNMQMNRRHETSHNPNNFAKSVDSNGDSNYKLGKPTTSRNSTAFPSLNEPGNRPGTFDAPFKNNLTNAMLANRTELDSTEGVRSNARV